MLRSKHWSYIASSNTTSRIILLSAYGAAISAPVSIIKLLSARKNQHMSPISIAPTRSANRQGIRPTTANCRIAGPASLKATVQTNAHQTSCAQCTDLHFTYTKNDNKWSCFKCGGQGDAGFQCNA